VIAATDWDLITLGAGGKVQGKKRVGRGVERLRFDAAARPLDTAFGFRPVGRRVARIPLDDGAPSTWESPANVLDLVVDPASENRPASLLIGGLDGVRRLADDGAEITTKEGGGPVWQLARGQDVLLALRDGRLEWLDPSLETVREVQVPAAARVLIVATGHAEGTGIAPEDVQSATVGSILEGGTSQAALATQDRLLLIDLAAGDVRFHASWPGIVSVAAGDLDGDGRDELIVGSGTRVTALWAPARLPP
jgi:hypothetical protein